MTLGTNVTDHNTTGHYAEWHYAKCRHAGCRGAASGGSASEVYLCPMSMIYNDDDCKAFTSDCKLIFM
jgi:hypothetical protein